MNIGVAQPNGTNIGVCQIDPVAGGVNASITQVATSLTLTPGTQAVATKEFTNILQTSTALGLYAGLQAVGAIGIVSITQVNGHLTLSTGTQTISTALGRTGYKYDSTNHWIDFVVEGTEAARLKNNGDLDLHGVVNKNAF